MAVALRNCLGVDIGSHSIRVAQMEMGKAGPRVVALLEEPIKIEPDQTESQRLQAIARQLQELLKKGRVRCKNAVFCVPGQSVFVRRIKLPKTTPERLARIIRFEARQQIPFPLDKTIMEYQVFEEGETSEVNVLLVAIKRDYITNFMKLVRRTGLRPVAISVSSLALYNFHELNNSSRDLTGQATKDKAKEKAAKDKARKKEEKNKKGKKKNEADLAVAEADDEDVPLEDLGFEEIQAYVNLGASLMDLAISKPGAARMIGFTRSVPLAGNEMDRAIRDKLALGDLAQARSIKERETAIISTEFEVEADPESFNMDASEAATAVADRLISELRRSLDFYISQPDGVAVDSIVLSGGLASLRFLSSYIEEKMGLPVQFAEPKHAQVRMLDPLPDPFCPFAIPVGLAMQGLHLAQNTINFLPEDIKNVRSLQEHPLEVVSMAAMLIALIGLSFNLGSNYIAQFHQEVNGYAKVVVEATKMNEEIKVAEARNEKISKAYEKLATAAGARDFWFLFLRIFLEKRPVEILIDELQLRLDGNVIAKGKSPSQSGVFKFLEELEKVAGGIFKVQINNISSQPIRDPRFPTGVYDFTITAKTRVRRPRIRTIGIQPKGPAPRNLQRNRMGGRVTTIPNNTDAGEDGTTPAP